QRAARHCSDRRAALPLQSRLATRRVCGRGHLLRDFRLPDHGHHPAWTPRRSLQPAEVLHIPSPTDSPGPCGAVLRAPVGGLVLLAA
nr:hypothetical protein [Tanacetum cinerariifolium]